MEMVFGALGTIALGAGWGITMVRLVREENRNSQGWFLALRPWK